jgi:cytochrome b6-f complex iron-sulfur subunit
MAYSAVDSRLVDGNISSMRLRVVPPGPKGDRDGNLAECHGCSRRAVLQGFAVTAATLLVGCPTETTLVPDAPPSSTTAMCGNSLCIDLNDPTNAALTMVDGALTVSADQDSILLMRTSATVVQAVSDICTHAGCSVSYNRINKVLDCPCHGSRYSLTGTVLRGPAARPLKRYTAQLDQSTNLVTITV